MQTTISVLIPAYQVEDHLARCLDSVMAQSFRDMEVCLVDDGSDDGTLEVARGYQGRDIPVRIQEAGHRGVSAARQELVRMARGEYLFFLDADDCLDPRAIEAMYAQARKHGADLVQCKMERTERDNIPPIDNIQGGPVQVYSGRDRCMAAFLSATTPLRCMLAAKLYRREVLADINFPIGKIHEDEAVMHRVMGNCRTVVSVELPLYHYYSNPESITKRAFSLQRYDVLDAILDRISWCHQQGLGFFARMYCLYYLVSCMKLYRSTAGAFGREDPHLPELLGKYRRMAEYFISTGIPDGELSEAVRRQGAQPMEQLLPGFFDTMREYYTKHYGSI